MTIPFFQILYKIEKKTFDKYEFFQIALTFSNDY
jgi:hypothetical protein